MNFEQKEVYFYNPDGVLLMPVSEAIITSAEVNDRAENIEKKLYSINKEMEFTASFETTLELFDELTRQLNPNEFTLQYTKQVQARKHRQKRINKKWVKRYGYKDVQVTIDGLKISNSESNMEGDICQYTMTLERG